MRGCVRAAPRGDEVHFRLFTDDLTDSFVRKTSRRCVDAVKAPLPRILVEVSSPPRVVSIVDWIVDDQLLEWHQVQACQLRHITFPQR